MLRLLPDLKYITRIMRKPVFCCKKPVYLFAYAKTKAKIICGCTAWSVAGLVRHPKNWFSHDTAQMIL